MAKNERGAAGLAGSGFLAGRGGTALCALGIALLTLSGWSAELVAPVSPVEKSSWASWLANGAAALVYLACIVGHRRLDVLLCSPTAPRALLACAALASLGRAASLFAPAAGLPLWMAYLGRAVFEAGCPLLLLAFLGACCRAEARWAAALIPAGYALAAAAHLALRAFPPAAVAALAALLPLAAGLTFAAYAGDVGVAQTQASSDGGRAGAASNQACTSGPVAGSTRKAGLRARGDRPATDAGTVTPGGRSASGSAPIGDPADACVPTPDTPAASSWTFPTRPVVLMCAYAFVFSFSLFLSEGPNPYGVLGMLLVALVALVSAVALPDRYRATFLYRMALPLIVAGLVCLAFLGEGRTVAVLFANSGNVAFMLFMLITLVSLCHRLGVSPSWMFGIVYLASRAALAVGTAAGGAFATAYPAGSPTSNLVMCVVVVAIVVLSTVFFNDSVVERSFGLAPVAGPSAASAGTGTPSGALATMSYSERVVWQCAQLARRYALTLREQEVFELMVQGMSAPDIAERAGISYGTVKTHVNHTYRKLDVHSRDEALALLHREAS